MRRKEIQSARELNSKLNKLQETAAQPKMEEKHQEKSSDSEADKQSVQTRVIIMIRLRRLLKNTSLQS